MTEAPYEGIMKMLLLERLHIQKIYFVRKFCIFIHISLDISSEGPFSNKSVSTDSGNNMMLLCIKLLLKPVLTSY